jgi:threonine/homoserine/homoserine lactone efflux protein
MTQAGLLLDGMAIGFSVAAPVGPIGVLCIRRSLAQGARAGLAAGLGAATADAAYGCVAGFGITAVSDFLVRGHFWLGLLGGAFLCGLGIRTFLSRPAAEAGACGKGGLVSAYASTFLLTLANPATILSFAAFYSGLGLGHPLGHALAGTWVLGVFLGSALWWVVLSCGVARFRSGVTPAWLATINRISGALLFAFGLVAFCRLWPA